MLPTSCPVCRRAGPAPCAECVDELERAPSLPPPPGVDRCYALLSYEDGGRELVARLKYRNARSCLRWLAAAMAVLVAALRVDVVTWIPTTATRRRGRGFDQAELLARAVARCLRVPCVSLLTRGSGPPQTGRNVVERRVGPDLRFDRHRHKRKPIPPRVLLVDDVVTTGSTVAAAAAALRAAGVREVSVVAAARTPLKQARAASN